MENLQTEKDTLNPNKDELSIDYFLYLCLEYENLKKELPQTSENLPKWPILAEKDQENIIETESYEELTKKLTNWYASSYPVLTKSNSVQLENASDIIQPVLMICEDISKLIDKKYQVKIPAFIKEEANKETWDNSINEIVSSFPTYHRFISLYLNWAYLNKNEKRSSYLHDLGDRPPVGKYAPGGGGDFDRDNRHGGGRRPQRSSHNQDNRSRSFNQGRRNSSFQKKDNGPQDKQSKNNKDDKQEHTTRKGVSQAIQKLIKDPNMQEIKLTPTNSYYRRIQHQQIKKEGYTSSSIGEGSERAVVIYKDKKEGGNED